MGGTPCKGTPNSNKTISIAILGLDNAGKTTTTRVLEKAPVDSVAPTIGFSQTEITHKNEKIKLIDLGGAKTFREAWRHYYDDAYGFVYVLDSSEEDRLGENRDVLKRLLQEEKVKGKPILILANKQDKAEALDKNTILEDLKIERLVNENQTLCRVELCTAKSMNRNGKNSNIDESIRHGFDWLIKTVYENYDILHRRVDQDVQKRNEVELKAKRERQERVQRLRDEREKQEAEEDNKDKNKDDDDDDEDTIKKGFVPIGQAVKNAEKNSTEKPAKDKSNHKPTKSKSTDENLSHPPKPAPRSFSQTRTIINDENNDDQDRSRRYSTEHSPQRKESPISRPVSSNNNDNEQLNSTDDQTSIRSITGKKKKVIGAGRHRLNNDSLPPLAPSSAASRREDLTQNKGPPIGTPRPQPLVAQWAITMQAPQSTAEKLTTIASDNELDDDNDRKKSKSSKRIVSPRSNNDNNNEYTKNNNQKKSTRHKQNTHSNDDDDNMSQRSSSSRQKSRSRLSNNDQEDEINSKQYYKKNNDDDDDDDSNRRKPSSLRKIANNNSSHGSRSRNNENSDDDLR
ncbi:unnamed protein product [Adineta steineri]|uniref:ADP-ribosylation factor-like protein 13B n=1 Tax=Adineta steineri TaxID=433720 RepID=A0A814EW82_9BILA|nr:unnamed protein product [Adineta steineri]CAF3695959.1 unnamed protein product [Adineta steineri]